ncbi:uncharacterized protein LOC116105684 [Pistacia vera]|uniref:uncharacterized protein LOC116105684 n=1 Tax=Pistacia vera TaxID=55513 RepID=UPI00126369D4|nr:uncharacterized protein LOC116105684 [Pistacia vera]
MDIWLTLEKEFLTESRAKTLHVKSLLQNTRKENMSMHDYFLTMKGVAENLSSNRVVIADEEFLNYILDKLESKCDAAVVNITTRLESKLDPISIQETQTILIKLELRLQRVNATMNFVVHNEFHGGLANVATLSIDDENKKTQSGQIVSLTTQQTSTHNPRNSTLFRSNFHSPGFIRQPSFDFGIGNPRIGNSGIGSSYYLTDSHGDHRYVHNPYSESLMMSQNTTPTSFHQTPGSTVVHADSQSNSTAAHLHNQALMVQTQLHNYHPTAINYIFTSSTVHDATWYMDSGATDHVTSDFSQLTRSTSYVGSEQLQVGNGELFSISHIGFVDLNCPFRTLHLRNVLCVPHITKNLLSVSKLTRDNLVTVEFFIDSCVVKDKLSKVILLKRMLKG